MVVAFPFVWLSNTLSSSINTNEDKVSREEITAMAEMGEDEGSIDEHESDIIENLFRLKEIQIEDILTPRSVIYAFEDKETVGNVMDSNNDIIFSRIPVFHENIDNIIGMVYKDTVLETMADDYFEKTGRFGPDMVLAENISDYTKLSIQTRLNGNVMQSAKLSQLIFDIPSLISYVSKAIPWRAGDVLVTGTPGGVGFKRKPPIFMKEGDKVEVEISEIGILSNIIKDEKI